MKELTKIIKSVDTFVNIATTSSSITLSFSGSGLKVKPKSTAAACGLTITNKVVFELVKQKYSNPKNLERAQQTINSFD